VSTCLCKRTKKKKKKKNNKIKNKNIQLQKRLGKYTEYQIGCCQFHCQEPKSKLNKKFVRVHVVGVWSVSVHVRERVRVCMYACACTRVHVHVCARACACACTCACKRVCVVGFSFIPGFLYPAKTAPWSSRHTPSLNCTECQTLRSTSPA
jgi:hypothetical protein